MASLFESGRAIDIILMVIAIEFAVLLAVARGRSRRHVALDAILALAPGACLLLALRASLTDGGWPTIAFWLAASFPIHLVDLWRRHRGWQFKVKRPPR